MNSQQYPKSISGIVIPRENCVMIDADFSQIEYRTLVALAHEQHLIDKFTDPDMDYHTTMASLMYGVPYALVTPKMRSDAKSFNFGIPYGMGFASLAKLLTGNSSKKSIEEAKEKYELYFKDQPNVRQFFVDVKARAKYNEYTETLWHRVRKYKFTDKDGNYSQKLEAQALRQAGNAVIQGCLDGDTLIQTKEFGLSRIKDALGVGVHVWDGDKWSRGDVLYSGKKQKCIVTFGNGQQIVCSPIHKFLVRSAKGNDRFVECKDLRSSNNSTNPMRVVTNKTYVKSDFTYNSDWARNKYYRDGSHQNLFLDDIKNSFDLGVFLGRTASDGSILNRVEGGSCILNYIAEHEENILPEMRRILHNVKNTESDWIDRENRNERMKRLYVYSQSFTDEVSALDIKHNIHEMLMQDTEVIRGFIRGLFDGDGGISGKTIALTFGKQHNFERMCRDIQNILLSFGIRSRYSEFEDRYKIVVFTYDNEKFMRTIGFINENKQEAGNNLYTVKDEHIFGGNTLTVKSVEITDEWIDMYDVCNTDGGYYMANGIITHNTAADIFKIAAARTFLFIRQNNLFGKFYVTNMVHDEQLTEVDVSVLNAKVVLKNLVECMELHLDGFPPLYVGAGVGDAWAHAKGKMAEIHPLLAEQFIEEAKNEKLFLDKPQTPAEVLKYFDGRVFEFRKKKVMDYIMDKKNWGQPVYPVVGNLLSLQFDNGVTAEFESKYTEKNGYTKEQIAEAMKGIVPEQIKRFIEQYNLDVDWKNFAQTSDNKAEDEEEDVEYDDAEEFDEDGVPIEPEDDSVFELLDEDDKVFGIDYRDIIAEYGIIVSPKLKICGVKVSNLSARVKDDFANYLGEHLCDKDDPNSMQVVYLKDNNTLLNTNVYVRGVLSSQLSKILGIKY